VGLAPAAPEAGLGVGLILLAIACVFLLALNKAWQFTLGALLRSLALAVSALPSVSILGHRVPPWGALANAVNELDNAVLHAIGVGIQETEKGLHALIGAMSWLMQETADQVAGLAQDTANALGWVHNHAIPFALNATVRPILRRLTALEQRVQTLVTHPTEIVRPVTRVIAPGLDALEAKVDALARKIAATGAAAVPAALAPPISITLPGAVSIPGDLTRGIDAIRKRLGAVTRTLTPAGIAGLVAGAVLSTLGLSWLKCRNVEKAAKSACGLNADVLDGLLAGLLALFGTFSLVEFAKYLQPVVGEVGGEVTHFWRAEVAGQTRDRAVGSPTLTAN
jgi:hypothetical protein